MAYNYIAKYKLTNVYLGLIFIAEIEQNLRVVYNVWLFFPTTLLSLLN